MLLTTPKRQWLNWSGSVRCEAELHTPADETELGALFERARREGLIVRPVGAGHSFSPLVQTDGLLVSLDRMNGIVHADPQRGEVRVRAGTRLHALGQQLHALGLAQENLGDIDVQSIAGALATGTHGTGAAFGCLSTQVTALRLFTPRGESIECSATQNADVFKAAQVSLGSLGIVTEVTLRCVPTYKLKLRAEKASLTQVLETAEQLQRDYRNFEFFWFPYTETVQLKLTQSTDDAVDGSSVFKRLQDSVLENHVFGALCQVSKWFPALCPRVSQLSAWGVATTRKTSYSHQVYATPRLVRFYEMEYGLPRAHCAEALLELQRTLQERRFAVQFPVEVRFVARDDIWLSPAYQRDSVFIAVHVYRGMPHEEYFGAAERIFERWGGRPHWGKMHSRRAPYLCGVYPEWSRFLQVREQLDPDRRLLNAALMQLFYG